MLLVASALYAAYAARLLRWPEQASYFLYVSLAIASFTFFEIGLNLRGVILERHSREPLFYALKTINHASSLICLVLTRTSILSFPHEGMDNYDPSKANGLMGLLMGGAASCLGLRMLARGRYLYAKDGKQGGCV